jgi:hypothetical protein
MKKKLLHSLMALALLFGAGAASIQPAAAHDGRVAAGVAAGIIGLGLLGAYAASRDRAYYGGECYRGAPRCEWVEGRCYFNDYGDRVCRPGYERCLRPTICE